MLDVRLDCQRGQRFSGCGRKNRQFSASYVKDRLRCLSCRPLCQSVSGAECVSALGAPRNGGGDCLMKLSVSECRPRGRGQKRRGVITFLTEKDGSFPSKTGLIFSEKTNEGVSPIVQSS